MPTGSCRLCQQQAELKNSHVIPAFVFRWLRETSGNGHIRRMDEPNRRVQDGLKRYWLCTSCEALLNTSETSFATNLFHPYQTQSGAIFRYTDWLMRFCVSVSWRVLTYFLVETPITDIDETFHDYANEASSVWREFLLDQRRHPSQFQQHILPLDRIDSATFPLAPNINRYLTRAIDIDLCRSDSRSFIYSKIGRFVILGFINEPNPNQWKGTKVNVSGGIIEPKKYILPRAFGEFLNSKAERMASRLASISDNQNRKIEAAFRDNLDRFLGSDAFASMQADIELFGDSAFITRKPGDRP